MLPFDYLQSKPRSEIEKMALDAGSNYAYFEQIARGYRRPSIKKAIRFVESSKKEMTLPELIPEIKDYI